MLFKVATGFGLEGVVARRAHAPYPRGKTAAWLKLRTTHGRHVDEEGNKWNDR